MGLFSAFFHLAGFGLLGGGLSVAAIAVGLMYPRFLYPAIVIAAVSAVATFAYVKGVRNEARLATIEQTRAVEKVLKREEKARISADRSVRHPGPFRLRTRPDPYARD